jgi:hypothetical protein
LLAELEDEEDLPVNDIFDPLTEISKPYGI